MFKLIIFIFSIIVKLVLTITVVAGANFALIILAFIFWDERYLFIAGEISDLIWKEK
jgi:hypothetical protein